MAGKKGRCPSCNAVLTIPEAADPEPDFELVQTKEPPARTSPRRPLRDPDEDSPRPARRPARDYDEDEEDVRPARRASRDYEDDDEDRPSRRRDRDEDHDLVRKKEKKPEITRPKPRPRRRRREESSWGSSFSGFNGGALVAGILMIGGATVWFVLGLMGGIIFFYPPILFVFGLISLFKGLTGQHD